MELNFPKIIASDRLQAVLDFWFPNSWDRNSKPPDSVFPRWFGVIYDENHQQTPIPKEEHEKIDQEIKENFSEDLKLSAQKNEAGYFNSWKSDKQGILALIILQDQMTRNIFRKKAEAFQYAELTMELLKNLLKNRDDKNYKFFERLFLYLPLEHSENLEDQNLSVDLYTELAKDYENDDFLKVTAKIMVNFAIKHQIIIQKFGRFPHRNEVLGRPSREEEIKYLNEGGDRFGQ